MPWTSSATGPATRTPSACRRLEDFAKEYGYRLRAEDFVDQGYYNAACRVPSKGYLDWMNFIHRFVVKFGKALVDKAHKAGKKTAIFWGDHWIGVEPLSAELPGDGHRHPRRRRRGRRGAAPRFPTRPGGLVKELRLYPYFFPDVFRPGGDPLGESVSNWIKIRRALMRKPVDRIGYGGYLSLALKFPKFVEHVAELCARVPRVQGQFRRRRIAEGADQGRRAQCLGPLEGLDQQLRRAAEVPRQTAGCHPGRRHQSAGMPGRPAGRGPVPQLRRGREERHSQGRGRDHQRRRRRNRLERRPLVDQPEDRGRSPPVRPSGRRLHRLPRPERVPAPGTLLPARRCHGRGQGNRPHPAVRHGQGRAWCKEHFITEDLQARADFGTHETFVYVCDPATQLLAANGLHVLAAAKPYGQGRSVFFGALPYDLTNARLLHRAIFWAAGTEKELKKWFCENPNTDCAFYPKSGNAGRGQQHGPAADHEVL